MVYIWGLGSYNGSFLPRPWWWCWGGRHPGDPFLSSLSDWFIGSLDYLRYNAWANWVPINIMVSLVSTRRLIPVSSRPSTLRDYLSPTAHCFGFFLGLGMERAIARTRHRTLLHYRPPLRITSVHTPAGNWFERHFFWRQTDYLVSVVCLVWQVVCISCWGTWMVNAFMDVFLICWTLFGQWFSFIVGTLCWTLILPLFSTVVYLRLEILTAFFGVVIPCLLNRLAFL